ncbi:protein-(glutamine-N5) methyltransferase, release factor-specific [Rhizobium sp. Leaf384]|uniref:peptide chain release factor N(5)-glutamine methyltransferase n=1 Tax=unclassified Rhizobium TaxID=2613769 RepID=UPI00071445C6|nr:MULTISPECIES: peptide chain release factor N(5)-glutamine methyltransferase [unclassified Rhizobium]KQS77600.1 protein-(glutamine-N5) methyltransferase, release factor-specific [Rhizobium sp. Leaf384]KQS83719.1 protein-(glutamine-N5) methyltransferase, release factor-specific [Rhizobium sp. Leaf383]
MTATIDSLAAEIRTALRQADFDDPAQEARLLIRGLLGLTPTELVSRGGDVVAADKVVAVRSAIARRLAREPLHRILGARDFYGLTLALSPQTLEPRPDTETLVEAMLPHVRASVARLGTCRILDLGTGTGAICLALLNDVEQATGVGVDLSADALSTAAANAEAHGLSDRFRTVESDWFAGVDGRYDIVVSNPPYIRSDVIGGLDPEVRLFDPLLALDGGADGLDAYRIIAGQVATVLEDEGVVGLEIGFDQKDSVTRIFEAEGFARTHFLRDLGGNDRVLVFRRADVGHR